MSLIERTVSEIPGEPDGRIATAVRQRWDSLTKPRGSLGVLETAVIRLAEIQNRTLPDISRPCAFVFCGEHGVTEERVSLYPSAVTREMAKNFVRGGAAINVLCRRGGFVTEIVDAGLSGEKIEGALDCRIAEGTQNFVHGPAMSREQATRAIGAGIELGREAAERYNLAVVGEMGIGNSTSASALLCAFTGTSVIEATGRGAGLDDAGVRHKQQVIERALAKNTYSAGDPLSIVAAFAGFEIAMMAGFVLGAASRRFPVVMDGFISGAAFLIARGYCPGIERHLFFGHRSAERGHQALLKNVAAHPLLDLGMCLGEGTGALLAAGILAAAVHLYSEMATFAEGAVSDIS